MLIHLSYVLIGGMHEPWGGTRRPILSCEDAELCECVNDAVTCQGKWNQMKSNEGKELYYMILSWKVITFEVLLIIISIRILSLWRCFQTFSLMYKDWYLNKYVFHVKPPLEIHFTQLKKGDYLQMSVKQQRSPNHRTNSSSKLHCSNGTISNVTRLTNTWSHDWFLKVQCVKSHR